MKGAYSFVPVSHFLMTVKWTQAPDRSALLASGSAEWNLSTLTKAAHENRQAVL